MVPELYAVKKILSFRVAQSIRFSKEATLQLEKVEDALEGVYREEARNKISVEIEDSRAKVETEIGGVEKEFTISSTERQVLISEISNKTGLNQTEVNHIIEIETHKKD